MVYVEYKEIPEADPVSGFVQHFGDLMFGVQDMKLPNTMPEDAVCDITLEPLKELARVGAIVWAHKRSEHEQKEPPQWRFICLPEDQDLSNPGKIHIFDFDMIKGFLMSEKEATKCPICKRGSVMKKTEKVSQIEVTFTEDLMTERSELRQKNDIGMALFLETKIVIQVLKNSEVNFFPDVLEFIRGWDARVLIGCIEQVFDTAVAKDSAVFLHELLMIRPELVSQDRLANLMVEACRMQSSDVIFMLIHDFEPPIRQECFRHLINYRNEYLLDELLAYYSKWTKIVPPENHLGAADWRDLGRYAIIQKEFPSFVRNVQTLNIYRLHSRMKDDSTIDKQRLLDLGLIQRSEIEFDPYNDWGPDEGDDGDDWDDGDDGDDWNEDGMDEDADFNEDQDPDFM